MEGFGWKLWVWWYVQKFTLQHAQKMCIPTTYFSFFSFNLTASQRVAVELEWLVRRWCWKCSVLGWLGSITTVLTTNKSFFSVALLVMPQHLTWQRACVVVGGLELRTVQSETEEWWSNVKRLKTPHNAKCNVKILPSS